MFAIDLEQLAPNATAVIDDKSLGHPMSLGDLPPGDYFAQAVINVYEQVRRADGKTIWLHMNDGTIEFFSNAAGNLYSDVVPVHVGGDGAIKITVNHVVPPPPAVVETEWIKRVKFQSPMLTKFWGRPIYIYASVLLPKGYAEHPDVYYPAIYTLGHGRTPLNFSTTPPRTGDPNAVSPVTGVQSGYATYQQWSGDGYPRVVCDQPRAADALLRRFVFCELGEQWSVRRRGRPGNDSVPREAIPNHRQAVRAPVRGRVDKRVAVAGAAAQQHPTSSAAHGSSSPIRSTSRATR